MEIKSKWQGKIHVVRVAVFVFICIGITACDNKKDTDDSSNTQKNNSIVLSADGVGPINATTSFNMHQLTLAFNDYNVVEEASFQDGILFPVIRVSEGVKTVITVIPDTSRKNIYSVIIEDNIITNNLGHHLGLPYNKIYPYGQTEKCQLGSDDMAGKVLCYAPNTPNILYVFNGTSNDDSATMPSADILQGWGLESIIWRPKS